MSKQYSVYISPPKKKANLPSARVKLAIWLDQIWARKEASSRRLESAFCELAGLPECESAAPPSVVHLRPEWTNSHNNPLLANVGRPMQAMITFISSPSSVPFSHCPRAFFLFYNFASHYISVSCRGKKLEKFWNGENSRNGTALRCSSDIKAVIDYIP